MKIGIFGGTFNPPHIGHIRAAQCFCREISPDILYILPSCLPPHKVIDIGDNPAHRFAMARLAFASLDCDTVFSAMELCRRGKSFTSDTLKELKALHPDGEFFLYVGGDMLKSFEQWHEFRAIMDSCTLVIAPRLPEEETVLSDLCRTFAARYGCRYHLLSLVPFEAASTLIRQKIQAGKTEECKNLLTDDILGYIIKNGLYADGNAVSDITSEETLQKAESELPLFLDEKRITHTLSVRDTALALCEIFFPLFGYEKERMRDVSLAALCHDMTKNRTEAELVSYLSRFMRNFEGASAVYHAYASAYFALERYKANALVFRSIYYHTTGCADMDLFEKIIFLSDYIEPNRTYPSCRALYDTVFSSLSAAENGSLTRARTEEILNRAVLQSLNDTYSHLTAENRPICAELFSARDFLLKELSVSSNG